MTTLSVTEDFPVLIRRELVELRGRVSLLQTRLLDKEKADAELEQLRKNEQTNKDAETTALTDIQKELEKIRDKMSLFEGRIKIIYSNLESLIAWTGFRNNETSSYENFQYQQIAQTKKSAKSLKTGKARVEVILLEDEAEEGNTWEPPDESLASDDEENREFRFQKERSTRTQKSSQYILPDFQDLSESNSGHGDENANSSDTFAQATGIYPVKSLTFKKDAKTNKFHCPVCPKKFVDKKDVTRHYRSHTGEMDFKCHLCPKKYIRKDKLIRHLRSKHDGEPPRLPDVWKSRVKEPPTINEDQVTASEEEDQNFDPDYTPVSNSAGKRGRGRPTKNTLELGEAEKEIQKAEKNVTTDKFHCVLCEKQFVHRRDLLRHFRSVHTGEKPFSCEECDQSFSRRDKLLKHKRAAHSKPGEGKAAPKRIFRFTSKMTEFPCDQCPKVFTNRKYAVRHINRHKIVPAERMECSICKATFPRKEKLTFHMLHVHGIEEDRGENNAENGATEGTGSVPEPLLECPTPDCNKKFAAKRYLDIHIIRCQNLRPFLCHECPKTFVSKSALMLHSYSVHRGIKRFICKDCNQGFYTSSNYKKHVRIHMGERPFKCQLCGHAFIALSDLRSHQRIHSGIKNFQCPDCPLKFFRRYTLVRHQRVHTGEKPYVCETCGVAFAQSGTLKTHKESHSNADAIKLPKKIKIKGTKYRVRPQPDLPASAEPLPLPEPVPVEGMTANQVDAQDSAGVVSTINQYQQPNPPVVFSVPPLYPPPPVEQSHSSGFESTVDFVTFFGHR